MVAACGDRAEVKSVLKALKEKRLSKYEPRARNVMFLMRALEINELMHIVFNAVERAVKGVPEWKQEEKMLKG